MFSSSKQFAKPIVTTEVPSTLLKKKPRLKDEKIFDMVKTKKK